MSVNQKRNKDAHKECWKGTDMIKSFNKSRKANGFSTILTEINEFTSIEFLI